MLKATTAAVTPMIGIFVLAGTSASAADCDLSIINASNRAQEIRVRGELLSTIPAKGSEYLSDVVSCSGDDNVQWSTGSQGLWPRHRKGTAFPIIIRGSEVAAEEQRPRDGSCEARQRDQAWRILLFVQGKEVGRVAQAGMVDFGGGKKIYKMIRGPYRIIKIYPSGWDPEVAVDAALTEEGNLLKLDWGEDEVRLIGEFPRIDGRPINYDGRPDPPLTPADSEYYCRVYFALEKYLFR
jgi:hypothetical protein